MKMIVYGCLLCTVVLLSGCSESKPNHDSLKSSWQYEGYVIDRNPDTGGLLFVWDADPQLITNHTTSEILDIVSPNAAWLGTSTIDNANTIAIGQKVMLNMTSTMATSYPGQSGITQLEVAKPEEQITVLPVQSQK